LEWGSVEAARRRFVWHERMQGSTVTWGFRLAGTAPRPRPAPVRVIRFRGRSGHRWPTRRGARRAGPL